MFGEIAASLSMARFARGLFSPLFAVCALLGFSGFFLPGKAMPAEPDALLWFTLAPFLEELTWRAIMQNQLASFLPGGGLLSQANILTSTIFAAAHVIITPCLMSALTFLPSLCLGAVWSKFRSLWLCGMLHLWYNTALRL